MTTDVRELIPPWVEVPVRAVTRSEPTCTYCRRRAEVVVRQPVLNAPLGHLVSRCHDHRLGDRATQYLADHIERMRNDE